MVSLRLRDPNSKIFRNHLEKNGCLNKYATAMPGSWTLQLDIFHHLLFGRYLFTPKACLKHQKTSAGMTGWLGILPRNLTWNLKMMVSKRNLRTSRDFFPGSMLNFRGAVDGTWVNKNPTKTPCGRPFIGAPNNSSYQDRRIRRIFNIEASRYDWKIRVSWNIHSQSQTLHV